MKKKDCKMEKLLKGATSRFSKLSCMEILENLNNKHRDIKNLKVDDVVLLIPDHVTAYLKSVQYDTVKKITPKSIILEHNECYRFSRDTGFQSNYRKSLGFTIYDTKRMSYSDVVNITSAFHMLGNLQYTLLDNFNNNDYNSIFTFLLYSNKGKVDLHDITNKLREDYEQTIQK